MSNLVFSEKSKIKKKKKKKKKKKVKVCLLTSWLAHKTLYCWTWICPAFTNSVVPDTNTGCNTPPYLNKTNWGTTAKIGLVATLLIKRNYISILIWSNYGAIWLVSCSFGHYNILQTDCLVSCVLFNKKVSFLNRKLLSAEVKFKVPLPFTTLWTISVDNIFDTLLNSVSSQLNLTCDANCL